jgi:hypothetical protein
MLTDVVLALASIVACALLSQVGHRLQLVVHACIQVLAFKLVYTVVVMQCSFELISEVVNSDLHK